MKIDVSNDLTISGGSISSSKYGISEENAPFVIKMMIDNLYSNKPLAIIREYITNAWDAHVDAGISDKPIEITVPTMFRPTLCIRDFGNGLVTVVIPEKRNAGGEHASGIVEGP